MCWDCYDNKGGDPYKDFRHGKVEIEDFDDEIPYRHTKRRTVKKKNREAWKIQRRPGCPENDYKPHVYVWTQENESEQAIFFRFFGFHRSQTEVCCGCGKEGKSKYSDRYQRRKDREWEKLNDMPKGQPVSRYRYRGGYTTYSSFRWEEEFEEYREFRSAEIKRVGWHNAYTGRYHW